MRTDSGSSLLTVLALLLILPLLFAHLLSSASRMLSFKSTIRSQHSRLHTLHEDFLWEKSKSNSPHFCVSRGGRSLCRIRLPHLIDSGRLVEQCALANWNFSKQTTAHRLLSPGALRSEYVCRNRVLLDEHLFTAGNLEIADDLPVPADTRAIISNGYVDFRRALHLNQPMLIAAHGDIFIQHVSASSSHELILLSYSGSVVVSSGSEIVKICAYAPQGSFAYREPLALEECDIQYNLIPVSLQESPTSR